MYTGQPLGWGPTMLRRPGPAIQHCQKRAAECEHLAELASNPATRISYLRLAECWRELAESHEFVEKLDNFLGYLKEENSGQG
jgi:hypothetical protein